MSIKFNTSGRPMIECINPECQKLHSIYRRGDYVKKAQMRVVCRGCGTKWHLNESDTKTLQDHYEARQQENEAKKLAKIQKNDEKIQKSDGIHNQQKTQKEPEQTQKKKQKGWLEELMS